MKGLDANQNLTDYARALAAAGYTFVCRYLPHSTKADPLTLAEAQHLSDEGLEIVSIYESHSPTTDTYFTYDQGVTDGNAMLAAAAAVGMPQDTGRPVFPTVDEDADPSVVIPYFKGIRSTAFLGPYYLGVYGSSAVCQALLEAGLVHYTWRAQPPDWDGAFSFGACVTQGPEINLSIAGTMMDVDTDTAADGTDFGQWSLPLPLHSGESGVG